MKKCNILVASLMAMNTSLVAQTYNAEGPSSYKELSAVPSHIAAGPYFGVGYSYINQNTEGRVDTVHVEIDEDINAATFIGGYNLNEYFAIEGRYSMSLGDVSYDLNAYDTDTDESYSESGDYGDDVYNIALYLKPMYHIENITLYGLLGYGEFGNDYWDETSFQWGVGASYTFNKETSIFIDYVRLYDDSESEYVFGYDVDAEITVDSLTFGFAYKF